MGDQNQVKVKALYDTVGFKPQIALDAQDAATRRTTEYFDKGEVRDIPQAEYDRLTDPVKFPESAGGPAVEKVSSSAKSTPAAETGPTTEDQVPLGAPVPAEVSGTPLEPHAVPGGPTPDQGTAGTPLTGSELEAALNAETVKTLQGLAKSNNVTVGSEDRKPDLVRTLAAAGVQPPAK